jgi:hypothetical protein
MIFPTQPDPSSEPLPETDVDLDLSPPPTLRIPLWRSLIVNLLDRISPERLPPLELTSQPVDVGLLLGDMVEIPWFRTVFTNLGDVISPELLPPLQLESRPVHVGELIGDQMSHPWWTSLLSNLRDSIARDTQPPLRLTAAAVNPGGLSGRMQLPRWSSVISTPKVFLPDVPVVIDTPPQAARTLFVPTEPRRPDAELLLQEMQLKRTVRFAHFREAFWIAVFAAQVITLAVVVLR